MYNGAFICKVFKNIIVMIKDTKDNLNGTYDRYGIRLLIRDLMSVKKRQESGKPRDN